MSTPLSVTSFVQSGLYQKGVPTPRVSRHGAPVSNPAVRKGQDYLRWAIKKFINGQTPNQYDYSKLEPDEIRLLQLRPAARAEEPILCIMFKAKRQDVVDGYEALSYTWGDIPKIHHPIYIDDKNPPRKEPRKDLWQAIAKVGHWHDKVKRLRREERQSELEKKIGESGLPEDQKLRLQEELKTLEEFHSMDEEWERMKQEWDRFKKDITLDKLAKDSEKARLDNRREELILKGEKLEKRYNDMRKGVQEKEDEQSIPVNMITERRKRILDQTQQPREVSNSDSTVQEFHVRPNLYAALVHLRRNVRPVNIWVDAICINQQKDGEKEKEEQLASMAEIYGNASNVCIWLGESNTQLKAALNFAQRMMDFSQLDTLFENLDAKPLPHADFVPTDGDGRQVVQNGMNNNYGSSFSSDVSKTQWYNLMHLLRFPWFSRRWIIQEIGMAKNASVHVGENVIHWDDLCDAINLLNEKADDLRNKTRDHDEFGDIEGLSASTLVKVIGNACGKDAQGAVTAKLMSLETLVCSLLAFDSFHAYDAIYSLLSLAADVDAENPDEDPDFTIKANFKRSTRDLFISFVRRSIIRTESLDIICRHWAPLVKNEINEIMILPSWVSNIERSPYGLPSNEHGRQHGENFVGFYHGDTRRRYNACANTKPQFIIAKLLTSTTPQKRTQPVKVGSIIAEESDNILSPTRNSAARAGLRLPNGSLFSYSDQPIVRSPKDSELENPMKGAPLEREVDVAATTAGASLPDDRDPETLKTSPKIDGASKASTDSSKGATTHHLTRKNPHVPPLPVARTAMPANLAKQAQMKKRIPHPFVAQAANEPRRGTSVSDKKDRLSGILSTQGFCIGTIADVSGPMDSVVDGKWVRKLGWISAQHNLNQVPDVLWRTLVADRGPDGGFAPHWYRRACLHVLADPKITDGHGYIKVGKYATRILGEMTARYLRRVDTVVMKRCIFSSKSLLNTPEIVYGLAPENTKLDDLVCILFGCSVPVILREITGGGGDDQGKYELIGEAYVHGKMQGEAVKEWRKLGSPAQTFNIA